MDGTGHTENDVEWELALQFRLSASPPLLNFTEWSNRGQPETPARRSCKLPRFAYFHPVVTKVFESPLFRQPSDRDPSR